ncbi:MAG: hemerythrin domain-containing protein [Leptospirales bacterium]|jgi:hypothetical protein
MHSIIQELKQEHEELNRVLESAVEAGVASKAGQALLLSARELLLAHLRKENEKIYAPLEAKAICDRELARIINPFLARLDDLSNFATDFFKRLEQEGGGVDFARSAGRLIGMIRNRVHQEEHVIFSEYEKLGPAAA